MKQDDRTPEEMNTHTAFICASDKVFKDRICWACKPIDANKVEIWANKRTDLKRISYNLNVPKNATKIFVVGQHHPSLI
jgi:hypothetical protein